MTELSRLADMAEILGVLVVVGGLIFAVLQMRNIRQQRRELAAIELFRSFGNPEFNKAYEKVMKLPDGLREELGSPDAFEWLQWLAERLAENSDPNEKPAFEAHRSWKPMRISTDV